MDEQDAGCALQRKPTQKAMSGLVCAALMGPAHAMLVYRQAAKDGLRREGGMGKLVCPWRFCTGKLRSYLTTLTHGTRQKTLKEALGVALLALLLLLPGCASTGSIRDPNAIDRAALRREALGFLKTAIAFPDNPAVRIQAIEALQDSGTDEVLPWIRTALRDEHPAVRFAAGVAVGVLRDAAARRSVNQLISDPDPNVRLAGSFAGHRLGDTRRSGLMPKSLLESEDVTVRRNAALTLGLMNERGTARVLAKAMKDPDEGVRQQALEALVRLGNRDAGQELLFMTNSGVGSQEVFAVTALASARNPLYRDTFAYKLATASHLETKLAAARGLGMLGDDRGFELALRSLSHNDARFGDPNDPPEAQILRVRQLAANALGAIGRVEALPALTRIMREESDARMQVSAAKAILEILSAERARGLPF